MRFQRLSVLSVLAAVLFAGALASHFPTPWGEMLTRHQWTHIPDKWVVLSDPPEGAMIELNIALKSDRENVLIDALKEVSQPGHPKYVLFITPMFEAYLYVPLFRVRYGAHLTKEQVAQLVAPHPDSLKLVGSWLRHNGVPPSSISTTHGGCWLTVAQMPVSRANKLLGASYQLYHHLGTNETILRTPGYALPSALHIHVQTVVPTTAFTSMHRLQHKETLRGLSGGAVNSTSGEPVNMLSRRQPGQPLPDIDPPFLSWLYRTEAYIPVNPVNELGIMGQLNEIPSLVDLGTFMTKFRSDIVVPMMPFITAVDDRYKVELGIHANLDTQYTMALAYPTRITYYRGTGEGVQMSENGALSFNDQYSQWLGYMSNLGSVPQTITLGYGTPEKYISEEYANALCRQYAQLGTRGVSILVASGDSGVGLGECKDLFGNVQFYTSFPASCMCLSLQAVQKQRYETLIGPS